MNLTFFSGAVTAAGIAALAGGLFWLQRLRVRHREVPVVTALFWREAVEETRARELRLRFRHPLAYLFILAICAALWLAAAGLRFEAGSDRSVVLLLDASAGMARGTRFDDALRNMRDMLEGLPASKRSAIACGATDRTLLLPGEELAWFDERVAGLAPEACPSSIEDRVFTLAAAGADRPTTVVVFGDAHLDASALDLLPQDFELVTSLAPRTAGDECGITALGVTPAASGRWSAVDVLVELSGSASRDVTLELRGAPLHRAPESSNDGTRLRLVFRDVPADGDTLTARLAGSDGLTADDTAALVLPLRRRVRVQADPELSPRVASALAADPGVELVEGDAEVVFGGTRSATAPGFTFDAELSGVVVGAPAGDPGLAAFLERLDTMHFGAAPVAIEVGSVRSVRVGTAALDDDAEVDAVAGLPLFVAEATRWLAGRTEGPRWVAAGRAALDDAARTDDAGHALDPVGADFAPPAAGRYASIGGPALVASLTDRATTLDAESAYRADASAVVERDPLDLVHWLALLAFVALLVEWVLVRRGRMP